MGMIEGTFLQRGYFLLIFLMNSLENIEISLSKMKILSKNSFEGTYSKVIQPRFPKLEITITDGKPILRIWLAGKSLMTHGNLSISMTEKLIMEAKKVPSDAEKMVNSLKALSFQ